MKQNGWIKLHRKLMESEIYFGEPFSRGQAWVDLLLLATHKTVIVNVNQIQMKLDPGELYCSQRALARRWRWGRSKVQRFLIWLSDQDMIDYNSRNGIITILGWCRYQSGPPNGPPNGPPPESQKSSKNNGNIATFESDSATKWATKRATKRATITRSIRRLKNKDKDSLHFARPVSKSIQQLLSQSTLYNCYPEELAMVYQLIQAECMKRIPAFEWKPVTGSLESDVKSLIYGAGFDKTDKERIMQELYNVFNGRMNWVLAVLLAVRCIVQASEKQFINCPYAMAIYLLKSPHTLISFTEKHGNRFNLLLESIKSGKAQF